MVGASILTVALVSVVPTKEVVGPRAPASSMSHWLLMLFVVVRVGRSEVQEEEAERYRLQVEARFCFYLYQDQDGIV